MSLFTNIRCQEASILHQKTYDVYISLLKEELTVAMGCTEPIAIAYAGAKVRQVLGVLPERCTAYCSGNIVKNVMGVTVPNSGGAKGIAIAALLGIVGGNAEQELNVLAEVTEHDIALAKKMEAEGLCRCELVPDVENLYIRIDAEHSGDCASVEIRDYHNNITKIVKNGKVLFDAAQRSTEQETIDRNLLNLKDILEFADTVNLDYIKDVLEKQIEYNSAIAKEGLDHCWGAQVGRTIMEGSEAKTLIEQARAYAAAGSDARMNGCAMPVVINSGSGNQGITVTMPLLVYAKAYKIEHERVLRALAAANLIAVHQKKYIGSLSAFCGVASAAAASACAIAYMLGADYEEIGGILTNTLGTIGGMVCDGAKSSCAAKISAAVATALLSMEMSRKGRVFRPGEGLVEDDVEATIASVGRMGRDGMHSTDIEILNIMLGK